MKWIIDVDVDTLNNCRFAIKNGIPTNEQTLIANGEAYYKCESIESFVDTKQ